MTETHRGGCLCGRVRFEAEGPLDPVTFCHCGQCRRQSGHYFAATGAPRAKISIRGEENIKWFSASDTAQRGFCGHCGSHLFWSPHDQDRMAILAGALDEPIELHPKAHIFVADKPDWYEIGDGLPQYDTTD